MGTSTRVSVREQQRRAAQAQQIASATVSALPDISAEDMAAAEQLISVVNLDEVTLRTQHVAYLHFGWEEVKNEDGTTTEKRTAVKRETDLILDIPAEILFELMQHQEELRSWRNMSPEMLPSIQQIIWKAWQFTDKNIAFEDIKGISLQRLVALINVFFNLGNRPTT